LAGDEKLTTALLDRLAHHATVIATKGKSYRKTKGGNKEDSVDDSVTVQPLGMPKTARKA